MRHIDPVGTLSAIDIFLETERLILRRFTESDVDNLVALDGDPAVMRYITGRPTPRDVVENEILPWILRLYDTFDGLGMWAAIERSTGEFLGWFELRPRDGDVTNLELGYRLRRPAWGKGFATEGSRALLSRAFTDLGVRRVFAETMAVNTPSRRVMERVGLKYARTFHVHFDDPVPGTEHGEVEYELLRSDWHPDPREFGIAAREFDTRATSRGLGVVDPAEGGGAETGREAGLGAEAVHQVA